MQAHIHLMRQNTAVKSNVHEEFSIRFEGMHLIMSNKNWYMHPIANKQTI